VLDAEKLMYCFECGICTGICPVAEILPGEYNPRSLLQQIPFDLKDTVKDKAIWLCAWCYRCYEKCPQRLRIPDILLVLKEMAAESGDLEGFKEALRMVIQEVPLPLACLYACFNPTRGDVEKPETSKAIEEVTASYSELTRAEREFLPEPTGEKIAVIGSGPAGLTAAQELAKKGYRVTVFESRPKAGGMLMWCIPGSRLPKVAVEAEVRRTGDLGVEILTDSPIGKDRSVSDLLEEGYEAVFVAIGAHRSRKLGIEGEDLDGVLDALEFLNKASQGGSVKIGEKVVVIGGGDVAMDAARIAKLARKSGAREVTIVYRRSREEMPANPWEIKETEEDGIKIEFLVTPKRIIGEAGRVSGLECFKMKLGKPDQSGRARPIPVEGSEFIIEADTVIPAIGESPDLIALPKGVRIGRGSTISVDPFDLQTGAPAIFAGGDAARGPATVIEAIVDGKRAADSIHDYITRKKQGS
jgi:NADPH-dependent glutamate synthase beta subunit-like oxidoreductase